MHFDLDSINMPIDAIPKGKKIIIYGVGEVAEKYTVLIEKIHGDNKIQFYLVSEINTNTRFHQKEILSFQLLRELEMNNYYYIIASFSSVRTMRKNLLQLGIKEENIHETIDMWSVEVMKENSEVVTDVYFYPQVKTEEQLSSILKLMEEIDIKKICYHASLIPSLYNKQKKQLPVNFAYISDNYQPSRKDFVFIWNRAYLFDRRLNDVKYKFCIDKTVSESITAKLINCFHFYKNSDKYLELSKRNWKELIRKYQGKDSLIFGNGPSLDLFLEDFNQISSYIKVVCNQIYLNENVLNKINPDIYLLYDHAYFMEENADSLEYILSVIRPYNCYLVVPLIFIPFLISRKNIDKNKIIGIDTYGNQIEFVTESKLEVKRMYSVITTLAVPVVSFLSPTIYFVGCDGKKQIENGENFWPYAAALEEETDSIKGEKVSEDSNEMKLGYEQHCNEFEKLIHYGEKLGKSYYTFTKSYIPILARNFRNP